MVDVDLAPSTSDQLVERLFGATLATLELLSVYLGWRLDLYRRLAEGGPQCPLELADRAGIDARYAREWLEQQGSSRTSPACTARSITDANGHATTAKSIGGEIRVVHGCAVREVSASCGKDRTNRRVVR